MTDLSATTSPSFATEMVIFNAGGKLIGFFRLQHYRRYKGLTTWSSRNGMGGELFRPAIRFNLTVAKRANGHEMYEPKRRE